MVRPAFRAVVVGFLAVLCLCSSAYSGTIRDDVSDSQYISLAAQYPSVGRIDGTTASSGFLASGTLIAPDWVLTAAHVVQGSRTLTFTINGTAYSADRWVANSSFSSGNLLAGNDIGLIHLKAAVANASLATPYTGSSEQGQIGTSVGYGMTGTGLTGYQTNWSTITKRAGQNTVDAFNTVRRGTPNVILMDFDQPGFPAQSSYGSAVPLPLEYLIAPGDSGGGLFANIDGAPQLIGVHSFDWGLIDGNPNADYGDVSGDTRVSQYISWIKGAMGSGGGGKGGGGGKPGGGKAVATDDMVYLDGEYEIGYVDGLGVVPEPATLSLLFLGGLALLRRRGN